jgi:hypothetical protein
MDLWVDLIGLGLVLITIGITLVVICLGDVGQICQLRPDEQDIEEWEREMQG